MTAEPGAAPLVGAFYLPQFHPVPENDAWWGRGFTEWTNVAAARPRFPGHDQPHLPGELGFYDLRVPEVREAQAALARAHGVDAFCYYHYWFHGRRMLERPFREVLDSGRPDFPFCLVWANENWTRAWDGSTRSVLVPQEYSEADDHAHIRFLIEAFEDPRYVRIGGRPLFVIYKVTDMPDPARTFDLWRTECSRAGVAEPYLVKIDSWGDFSDPAGFACDAAAEFFPHGMLEHVAPIDMPGCREGNRVVPYDAVVDFFSHRPSPSWTRYPCVAPGWDNSSRRGDGLATIVHGRDPASFGRWVRAAAERARRESSAPIVFVNAWNEWAEGAHLEPDQRWGRAFLEALAGGLDRPIGDLGAAPQPGPVASVDVAYHALYERHVGLQADHAALRTFLDRRLHEEELRWDARVRELEQQGAELASWAIELRDRSSRPVSDTPDVGTTGRRDDGDANRG